MYHDFHKNIKQLFSTLIIIRNVPWAANQHKRQIFEIEIYTSSESWINKLSIDVWFVRIGLRYNYLKIWNLRVQKNLNIEKIAFKFVQIKFLACILLIKN